MPKRSIMGELLIVALPLIVTNACSVLMQFTDRVFLSWHSPEALAACVPAGSLAFTFAAIFVGLASYTGVFVAQYHGQKKKANISVSLWQGIIVSVISGLLIACMTPAGVWFIGIFKHSPDVLALERQYFTILNSFNFFVILNSALAAFFIGRGKTAVPMTVAVLGNVFNLVFDYVFIFGMGPVPSMGIQGAAIASVMGSACMSLIYIFWIMKKKYRTKYRVNKLFGFYKPAFVRLVRYGVPNGFGFFMDILSFSMFTFMVGHIDTLSLAASNIVMSMQSLSFMPILGLGMAVQVLVGQYIGKNRKDQVGVIVKSACKIGFAYAVVLSVLFFFVPKLFIGIFLPEGAENALEITRLAMPLMNIISIFILGDCAYLIFGDAIRGAGDTKFHMFVMLTCAWGLLVPGTYVIVYVLHAPVFWVWMWLAFYAWITAVFMTFRYMSGHWRKINITA
ncbi:multidrug resistance protein [Parelusimicrobium proximum]|uniref:MATE family efflux transporter n=1 Tax=Parelusimicrobium proximum TaxID=3228953 RepID=UPI003D181CA3